MNIPSVFDIKSASLDLLVLILKNNNMDMLQAALQHKFKKSHHAEDLFILDLNAIESPEEIDIPKICMIAANFGIKFIALRHKDENFSALASHSQLMFQHQETNGRVQVIPELTQTVTTSSKAVNLTHVDTEYQSKQIAVPNQTKVINRPIRAGQQIYAKDGDVILLAMVSAGAEVIADGNIHVYAPLRGRALAGARGNRDARIFIQSMQAELVSIAGVYRTMENELPVSIKNKSVQIYLEQDRLVMKALDSNL